MAFFVSEGLLENRLVYCRNSIFSGSLKNPADFVVSLLTLGVGHRVQKGFKRERVLLDAGLIVADTSVLEVYLSRERNTIVLYEFNARYHQSTCQSLEKISV